MKVTCEDTTYNYHMVMLLPQIIQSQTHLMEQFERKLITWVELEVFGVTAIRALFRLVIGEASFPVSHCNHGNVTPSIKTGRDLGTVTGRLLTVSGFISPPMDELASLLSPSSDEISVSSTFEIKSSIYLSASSVKRIDTRLLSLLLWTEKQKYINNTVQINQNN